MPSERLTYLNPETFVTRQEAIQLLDRSQRILHKRVNRGDLTPIYFGRRPYYRREEVEQMAENQEWLYGARPSSGRGAKAEDSNGS
jgi:hypothetical protein